MSPVSMISSQGMALASAMAFSGTVILLTFYRTKSTTTTCDMIINSSNSEQQQQQQQQQPQITLRSCIYEKKRREKSKKKRVHFAEDVVDPVGNSEEFRRRNDHQHNKKSCDCWSQNRRVVIHNREMPANHMALYSGILQNRVHRVAC